MLTVKHITSRVNGRELLSDVSAEFAAGKLHLITGPNGAGKTTLIKILARLLKPTCGSVEYDGEDVAAANELMLARRRAVLSQAVEIAFPLNVREVIMMGRYPHFGGQPGPVDERIVEDVMEMFEVTEFAARNYQTLSGGERQRVNFARVLAQLQRSHDDGPHQCRYLFLDEPLTFLDIRHQIDFMKKIRAFADSTDVVTIGVVHDLNLAARFADQILILNEGRIVAGGSPSEVLTAESILNVFGVEPRFVENGESWPHMIFE